MASRLLLPHFAMSSFPNELWMNIFEELEKPSDLAAVVRSNKRFRSLGERVLYRHIVWSDPRKFVQNHPFLLSNPALRTVVRTLTLGISQEFSQLDRIEQLNRARAIIYLSGEIEHIPGANRAHEARILEEIGITSQIDILASRQVTTTMYTHATAFTNLRELNFKGMVLPDTFYAFVHHFPSLDKLSIENCTPPLRPEPTTSHPRDLPITELTVLGLRGRRDPREMRSFGEGQQLRVIRFDWTCYIYKHFCESPNPHNVWAAGFVVVNLASIDFHAPPTQGFGHPPQHILPPRENPTPSPFIHTIDVKFPTQKSWQSYVSEPHDQLINPFAEFLAKCPNVTNLKIRNYLPWLRLSDAALPNLNSYQGPLTTIKSVVSASRRIKHLDIRDPAEGLAPIEKTFREVESSGGDAALETLSLFIGWWDDEILYAVLHHFRGLRELEIVYKEGDPTEEMVLSMGAHFFGDMPNLRCARVFKVIPANVDHVGAIAESLSARGYPQRSIQLALGELIGVDGPVERTDLDDSELEEARYFSSPSCSAFAHVKEDTEEMNLKELVNAWNRYCPTLREVQLKAGYVWRRAGEGDAWTKRTRKVTGRIRNAGSEGV